MENWTRIPGTIVWRNHNLPAHAYVMRAPRSYTREDVVELHVPALQWVLSELLDTLVARGARIAQPGEFTRRAYENGRLTLDQAEAVGGLILSRTADEARAFAARLRGHGHGRQIRIKQAIEDLLAQVELGLDFAQEDVVILPLDEIRHRIHRLESQARALADRGPASAEPAVLTAGLPRVLLVGATNAGKSRLFNALLGRDAAIVSSERHTTRDSVEAAIRWTTPDGPVSALLIDSAGGGEEFARSGAASLLDAAWQTTRSAIASADILLLAVDRSIAAGTADEQAALSAALHHARPAAVAIVWTKSDLPRARETQSLPIDATISMPGLPGVFEVSALDGRGLDALSEFLKQRAAEIGARTAEARMLAATSVRAAAQSAATALARAGEALDARLGEDVVAVELREAIHAFWQAEGVLLRHDALTEATLDRIFSSFCIGK